MQGELNASLGEMGNRDDVAEMGLAEADSGEWGQGMEKGEWEGKVRVITKGKRRVQIE